MKIVLLKNTKHDYETILEMDRWDAGFGSEGEHIQISEPLEVDFKMIEVDETAAKVDLIDKDIQKAKAGIELLEQAKAELLSLPDMSNSNV